MDNTGHIDKELLTQIFTEEGEAFSEVDFLSSQEKILSTRKKALKKKTNKNVFVLKEEISSNKKKVSFSLPGGDFFLQKESFLFLGENCIWQKERKLFLSQEDFFLLKRN